MPIKWTVDAERQLLLLILKIQGRPFAADAKTIAKLWQGSEKPSPRAIVERIAKLRKIVDAGGGNNDDLPPTPSKTPSPPSKRKATATASSSSSSGGSKRARTNARKDKLADQETDDSEPELSEPSTPRSARTRRGNGYIAGGMIATGNGGGDGNSSRRSSVYVDSEAETAHESDTSGFQLAVKEEPMSEEAKFREPSVALF